MMTLFAALLLCLAPQEDASDGLQKRILDSGGTLALKAGTYRLTKTLEFDLAKLGAAAVRAEGPVTLVMAGPGPALRFTGTHEGTASPKTFKPETWNERMPLVDGIEILGAHAEADGIELVRTMQPTITRVAVRNARHGIHLIERNRNVVISNCHLYENSGVGIYLDGVNLHQINVTNCHVSYNRRGGIVVRDGQVRNLQIGTCDIEGNMPGDTTPTRAANVWIDLSSNDGKASVAEVSITGCTIQHSASYGKKGKIAPGGANIRIAGRAGAPVDNVTIGNNVMSDVTVNVEIDLAKDVVLTGNTFFTSMPRDLVVTRSRRVVASGNVFNPREEWAIGGIVFRDSADCMLAQSTIHGFRDASAAVLVEGCSGTRVVNCILTDCDRGIVLRNATRCAVLDCSVAKPAKGGEGVVIEGGKENRRRDP